MKRFLKDTGVVRPTNKAFAFKQLEDALEWVEARELTQAPTEVIATETVDLRDLPLLTECAEAELLALEQAVLVQKWVAGKKIFKRDKDDGCLYFVRSGLVKLAVALPKKDSLQLKAAGPGDILCTSGFTQSASQPTEALTLLDTEAYILSRSAFDQLALQHPKLANTLLNAVLRDHSTTLAKLADELSQQKRAG